MLYRIAVYAGLFLLGYTLGRTMPRSPPAQPGPSGTSRIRDTLAGPAERTPDARSPRRAGIETDPGQAPE